MSRITHTLISRNTKTADGAHKNVTFLYF
jgi:hypothetical protein